MWDRMSVTSKAHSYLGYAKSAYSITSNYHVDRL